MERRDFIRKTAASGIGLGVMPALIPSSLLGKSAPSNRIQVAMIGCGRQTVTANIPQMIDSDIAQITVVCDVDSWRLENARKQVDEAYTKKGGKKYKSCRVYKDYREIMRDKEVDAVMISTPDHWHVPIAIDAARAGKHISLEKPISTCIQHGRELVKAIRNAKVITRNDSEFRTIPEFFRAVELVRNGRIGKIKRIQVSVPAELNGSALPPQPAMPVPEELNYDMWLGPAFEAPYTEKRVHAIKDYGRPGWMRVDSYCNGMITNWGAHLMGIAQWGNNSEYTGPVSIEGRGTFDKGLWNSLNQFEIRYEFADGVEVDYKIERPYVRFEGSEGWVEVEYPNKLSASKQSILDSVIGLDEMQIKEMSSDKEDFLLSIKEGKQSLEPLETAHRTISMCQLGLISIQTGAALKWNPELEEILGDSAATAMLNRPIREKYFKF